MSIRTTNRLLGSSLAGFIAATALAIGIQSPARRTQAATPLVTLTGYFGALDPVTRDRAIDLSARYVNGRSDYTTPLLLEVGFDRTNFIPPLEDALWSGLSSHRKIAIGYKFAEAAEPGRGGELFLALLAKALANEYESARAKPALGDLVNSSLMGMLRFARPPGDMIPGDLAADIPPEARRAIGKIADYLSTSTMGPPSEFIARHVKLPGELDIIDVLINHDTLKEALEAAVLKLAPSRREAAVGDMVEEIRRENESARAAPEFAPFAGRFRRNPGGGPESGPTPAAPERPLVPPRNGPPTAAQDYQEIIDRYYHGKTKESSPKFEDMSRKVRGFGGIVLGNTVRGRGIPTPTSLTCKPSADGKKAELIVGFGSEEKILRDVLPEDAELAYRIVCTTYDGLKRGWETGYGIGLVSVQGIFRYVDSEKWRSRLASKVILHPALLDRELGYAAVMIDSMPLERRREFCDAVERHTGPSVGRAIEMALFSKKVARARSLMFLDVPMAVVADGRDLALERDDDRGQRLFPDTLRRSAFLELHVTSNETEGYDVALADAFYELMPAMTRSSYDLDRLNRFAAVVALFRWVKESKGTVSEPPTTSKNDKPVRTPDALAFTPPPYKNLLPEVSEPILLQSAADKSEPGKWADEAVERLEKDEMLKPWIAKLRSAHTGDVRRLHQGKVPTKDPMLQLAMRLDAKLDPKAINSSWEEGTVAVLKSVEDIEMRQRLACWIELTWIRRRGR